jgi:Mce-associated membrane protein
MSLVAVLTAALGACSVWLLIELSGAEEREAGAQAAEAAARQAVVNLVTTDPAHAQDSFTKLRESATGPFASQLSSESDAYVNVVKTAAVVSQGSIDDSAVSRFDGTHATVLVLAKALVRNGQAPAGDRRQYRMSLNVELEGDKWLVSGLDFVA